MLTNRSLHQPLLARRHIEVAVTGHRIIADDRRDLIAQQCQGALRALASIQDGQSRDKQIRLLSCFAKGADQLVAGVAVALGVPVVAVIPLDWERYCRSERIDVEAWCGAQVVQLKPEEGVSDQAAYQAANLWMLQRCDILIAIWDGGQGEVEGSTAAAVQMARERGIPTFWINPSTSPEATWLIPLPPSPAASDDWDRSAIEGVSSLDDAYRVTDSLAGQMSWRHRVVIRAVYGLSTVAVMAAVGALDLTWASWIELSAMTLIVLLVLSASWSRFNVKWMQYRLLAEECRLARLGRQLGIVPPFARGKDTYARLVVRDIALQEDLPGHLGPAEICAFIAEIRTHLHEQVRYHRSVAARYRRRAVRLRRLRVAAFAVSMLAAAAHLSFHPEGIPHLPLITQLVSIAGPIAIGALTAMLDHTSPEALFKHSSAAATLLLRHHQAFNANRQELSHCMALYNELCELQSVELEAWDEAIRERPVELPG